MKPFASATGLFVKLVKGRGRRNSLIEIMELLRLAEGRAAFWANDDLVPLLVRVFMFPPRYVNTIREHTTTRCEIAGGLG